MIFHSTCLNDICRLMRIESWRDCTKDLNVPKFLYKVSNYTKKNWLQSRLTVNWKILMTQFGRSRGCLKKLHVYLILFGCQSRSIDGCSQFGKCHRKMVKKCKSPKISLWHTFVKKNVFLLKLFGWKVTYNLSHFLVGK